jgi:hypothetical protein
MISQEAKDKIKFGAGVFMFIAAVASRLFLTKEGYPEVCGIESLVGIVGLSLARQAAYPESWK